MMMASFIAEPGFSMRKQATVIPIPKVQPPKSIKDDLRSIFPTATLAKHLKWFAGQQILLDPQQFGILEGQLTTYAL